MIRISLLPPGQVRSLRQPLPAVNLLWAGAAALVLLGAGGLYGWKYAQLHALQRQLAAEQAKLQRLEAEVQRADRIAADERSAAEQEAHLRRLRGRTWSPLLLELRQLTPPGITWVHLSLEQDAITIAGRAEKLADLAQFMAALGGSPSVVRVDLHSAKEESLGPASSGRVLDFELAVQLAPLQGGNANGA